MPDLSQLGQMVRQYWAENICGPLPRQLTIILPDGTDREPGFVTIPYQNGTPLPSKSANFSASAPDLSELEAAILAAFNDEKERFTGEKLASKTIYPYGSHFKSALAVLHRLKYLSNHSPGYSRTPIGSAALEAYREAQPNPD